MVTLKNYTKKNPKIMFIPTNYSIVSFLWDFATFDVVEFDATAPS
jgi:hypothetical protein